MNLFQSTAITVLVCGLVAAASADTPSTTPSSTTPATTTNTDTTSSSNTIHIGETYQEHLQNEMNKNAAQAQQGQQPKQDPQRIGKPVEIDGANQ